MYSISLAGLAFIFNIDAFLWLVTEVGYEAEISRGCLGVSQSGKPLTDADLGKVKRWTPVQVQSEPRKSLRDVALELGEAFRDVLKEGKRWRGSQHSKNACIWGEGFKNPPALAVPAEGQLWAHQRPSFPTAGGRVPEHKRGSWEAHHDTHNTVMARCSMNCFQRYSNPMSHFHVFYSILSSCTHWHVNPVY